MKTSIRELRWHEQEPVDIVERQVRANQKAVLARASASAATLCAQRIDGGTVMGRSALAMHNSNSASLSGATDTMQTQHSSDPSEKASAQSARWLAFLAAGAFQPKLTIGAVNDPLEREADAAADRVMGSGEAQLALSAGRPLLSRKCAACEDEQTKLQRKASGPDGAPAVAPPLVESVLNASGQSLDPATQNFMGRRFRHDFNDVRIHNDATAAQSAAAVGARAYTVGRDIVFGAGQFDPVGRSGRHLLAHELAHVVQQGHAASAGVLRRSPCGHDGGQPRCGGGALARWNLVDVITGAAESISFDNRIVRDGLIPSFGGNWITQVLTPPNPRKSGKDRGFIDGARISGVGALSLEIVEVKSCATEFGGCALATREAEGYKQVLDPLGPKILSISASLSTIGGLRIPEGAKLKAADALILQTAGIDLNDQTTASAWKFYNGLQNRLDTVFTTAFTGFNVSLFADGSPGQDYTAGMPVLVECTTKKKKPGMKTRRMLFQVNGKGGVSYRCKDSECKDKDEKEKEQVQQPVAQPQEVPNAQPLDQQVPKSGPTDKKKDVELPDDEAPWQIPVVVGGGALVTAAAIAAARRRAEKLAAERIAKEALERAAIQAAKRQAEKQAARNVINLAERRAAKELAEKGGERVATRVAGKAVGKALLIGEIAAGVFLVFSGRAEAKVGFGPSPLEALYDSMTRSGNPPSDEMKALIESDPVLRKLAEDAATSGDPGPLQEEATKRMMELVRDNPGEFTAEELEILSQASNSGTSGTTPETREQLRTAIDNAIANQGKPPAPAGASGSGAPGGTANNGSTGSGAASPGATGATGTTALPSPVPNGVSSGDLEGEAATVVKKYPGLSPAMQGSLAAAPPAVRAVFDALTGPGKGLAIDDTLVGDFLSSVPPDLTAEERDKLIANVKPITSEDVAAVMESVRTAVTAIRAPTAKPLTVSGTEPPDAPPAEAGVVKDEGDPTAIKDAEKPQAGTQGDTKTPDEAAADAAQKRVVETLLAALKGYGGWGDLQPGQGVWVGKISAAKAGTEIGLYHYYLSTKSVRFVAFSQFRVVTAASKSGDKWSGVVVSATDYVSESGIAVQDARLQPGTKVNGTMK